ncbi:uncharacterized protein B0H18DRAFT_1113472 [Fomitopsis serialis]|uniref:uncharacterized protein n=1 Tax=Fomitopsis serialis TaxID=139415 RepID=UPI0020077891|nr:uncharacterized protein B0H18DRAFT_1113472 [Neoantrodia serialis]KAH9937667.1 hypothetical protein B0H18DRAFT_1113472 [Neoantrodia serialis]
MPPKGSRKKGSATVGGNQPKRSTRLTRSSVRQQSQLQSSNAPFNVLAFLDEALESERKPKRQRRLVPVLEVRTPDLDDPHPEHRRSPPIEKPRRIRREVAPVHVEAHTEASQTRRRRLSPTRVELEANVDVEEPPRKRPALAPFVHVPSRVLPKLPRFVKISSLMGPEPSSVEASSSARPAHPPIRALEPVHSPLLPIRAPSPHPPLSPVGGWDPARAVLPLLSPMKGRDPARPASPPLSPVKRSDPARPALPPSRASDSARPPLPLKKVRSPSGFAK